MADLSKIATADPIIITDGSSLQAALGTTAPTGTEVAQIVRNIPSGTQAISAHVTLSSQTVTLSSNTVTLSSQTVTLSSNTVTLSSQTVTIGASTATVLVSGTVTTVGNTTLGVATGNPALVVQGGIGGYPVAQGLFETTSNTFTAAIGGTTTINQAITYSVTANSVPHAKEVIVVIGNGGTGQTITSVGFQTQEVLNGQAYNNFFQSTVSIINNTTSAVVFAVPQGIFSVGFVSVTLAGAATASTFIYGRVFFNAAPNNQPVDVNGSHGTTATMTNITVSNVTSTQLLASNANRRMAAFWNDDTTNNIFLKWGTGASGTSYTVEVSPQGYYELPIPAYCGAIEALAAGGSPTVRVTEF